MMVQKLLVIAALALFCCGLPGCNVAGLGAAVAGGPDVKPQYVLGPKRTIVVVKDIPDPTGHMIESEQLSREIDSQLRAHVILPLIPSAEVAEIRSNQTDGQIMSPAQIGHAAGAQQVICVRLQTSTLDAGPVNDVLKGKIEAAVSVIDVSTDKTLWPTDGSDGVPVSYDTPMLHVDDEVNARELRGNLYLGLADKVALLFYKHKPEK